ncbi:MAG: hypothetical protein U0168_14150 [Nannocystaceae bacterium]
MTWRDGEVPPRIREAVLRGLEPERARRWPAMAPLLAALRPRRARSRALPIAVIAIATVGTAGVAAIGQQPPCTAGSDIAADRQDPTRQAAVRTAFEAAGADAGAFVTVDEGAVVVARAWSPGHDQACEATRVPRHQSEAVLDARRLDAPRRSRPSCALLEAADAHVVQRAAAIASPAAARALQRSRRARPRAAPSVLDDETLAHRRSRPAPSMPPRAAGARPPPAAGEFAQVVREAEDAGTSISRPASPCRGALLQPTLARTRDLLARPRSPCRRAAKTPAARGPTSSTSKVSSAGLDVAQAHRAQALAAVLAAQGADQLGVLEAPALHRLRVRRPTGRGARALRARGRGCSRA